MNMKRKVEEQYSNLTQKGTKKMNTPDTTKEVIALAEKIKAKYELEEETDNIAARIYAAIFESDDLEEAPEEDLEEVKTDPIKAALNHHSLEWDLTEYFYKIFDDRGIMATFDELLTLIEMFAEECAALEYDARPKAWTYARSIAALIASLEFEEDQQRAINFLENPADRFENFKGAH